MCLTQNFLEKSTERETRQEYALAMIQCKVLKQLENLEQQKYDDEDISEDIKFLLEKLGESVQDLRYVILKKLSQAGYIGPCWTFLVFSESLSLLLTINSKDFTKTLCLLLRIGDMGGGGQPAHHHGNSWLEPCVTSSLLGRFPPFSCLKSDLIPQDVGVTLEPLKNLPLV